MVKLSKEEIENVEKKLLNKRVTFNSFTEFHLMIQNSK